jgi:hypothetical protein
MQHVRAIAQRILFLKIDVFTRYMSFRAISDIVCTLSVLWNQVGFNPGFHTVAGICLLPADVFTHTA